VQWKIDGKIVKTVKKEKNQRIYLQKKMIQVDSNGYKNAESESNSAHDEGEEK
jgi:hypothetical protein